MAWSLTLAHQSSMHKLEEGPRLSSFKLSLSAVKTPPWPLLHSLACVQENLIQLSIIVVSPSGKFIHHVNLAQDDYPKVVIRSVIYCLLFIFIHISTLLIIM